MRFLTFKDSGHEVHDSHFFAIMDLYRETGLFIFLADAFLICRDKGYDLPEDLLSEITKHFTKFVNADEQTVGLAALGFDNNKDGGAWQGKAARAKAKQAQILTLVGDLKALTSSKDKDIFNTVASVLGTTFGHVKNLYYKNKKLPKPRGIP